MIETKDYHIKVIEPKGNRFKLKQLKAFVDGTREYVLFRTSYPGWEDKLCLLIHGKENGRMVLKGKAYTEESIIRWVVDNFLKGRDDIKEIKTVSCYGGKQDEVKYKGITMSSMHDCEDKVYSAAFVDNKTTYRLGIPK